MAGTHRYEVRVSWTGNRGSGTSGYTGYDRDHEVGAPDKPVLLGSADPAFRGDHRRWNPEELLVASLSQCHLLWYLHLAATAGVVVTAYIDTPVGTMTLDDDGGGRFSRVVLHPRVSVAAASMTDRARSLHDDAHALCFIARSMNFAVEHVPTVDIA